MEVQRLADTAEQLIVSQWDDFMDGYGRATARRKRDGSPVTDTDENIESRLHTLLEKETGIAAVGEETIGCVSSRGGRGCPLARCCGGALLLGGGSH